MQVKFKKLHPDAVTPYKTYDSDFCYDVVAVSREKIAPHTYKYGIGLAFEIDHDITAPFFIEYFVEGRHLVKRESALQLSVDFRPRSSVWKTGMSLSCCTGTIDDLFRGEVSAVFYHVIPDMPIYNVGDRIGQIKLGMTLPMEFIEADELSDTTRGAGGYGSTGT